MKQKLPNNYLINTIIAGSFLLNIIWVIPNTIFLRNILLYFLFIIFTYSVFKKQIYIDNHKSLFYILVLVLWLLFHVTYIGNEPGNQYLEYISTWLRAIIGFIIGLTLSSIINEYKYSAIKKYFYLSGTILFVVNFVYYSIINQKIYLSGMYDPLYKSKVALILVCLPGLSFLVNLAIKKSENLVVNILLIYAIYVIIFIIGSTRNGIIISTLIIFFTINILLIERKYYKSLLLINCIALFAILVLEKYAINMYSEILYIIKNYTNDKTWMSSNFEPTTNIYSNLSYYIRISHFLAGIELIITYPLGYGLLEGSFPKLGAQYWGDIFKYNLMGTHSGIVDLTLAYGIPFLILNLIFFIHILMNGINSRNYLTITIISTIFFILIFTESASKHSIEYLYFLLGLISNNYEK